VIIVFILIVNLMKAGPAVSREEVLRQPKHPPTEPRSFTDPSGLISLALGFGSVLIADAFEEIFEDWRVGIAASCLTRVTITTIVQSTENIVQTEMKKKVKDMCSDVQAKYRALNFHQLINSVSGVTTDLLACINPFNIFGISKILGNPTLNPLYVSDTDRKLLSGRAQELQNFYTTVCENGNDHTKEAALVDYHSSSTTVANKDNMKAVLNFCAGAWNYLKEFGSCFEEAVRSKILSAITNQVMSKVARILSSILSGGLVTAISCAWKVMNIFFNIYKAVNATNAFEKYYRWGRVAGYVMDAATGGRRKIKK